jgi:CHAD domain-containing protein
MDVRLAQLPLSAYAREQLSARLIRLEDEWSRCAEYADADSVHDLRVAIRRFGESLRLFKDLFRKQPRKQVRAELRLNMSLGGRTRDADIARDSFARADIELSPELDLHLSNERAVAEAALRASLAAGLGNGFGGRWRETLGLNAESPWPPEEVLNTNSSLAPRGKRSDLWLETETAAANARHVLPVLLEQFCKAGERLARGGFDPAALHGLRLEGKHLRYTLELFRPIYGRRMDDLIAAFKDTQTRLGDISDATATTAWLKSEGIHRRPEAQQLQLFLHQRARKLSAQFVEYWRDHWGLPAFRQQWIRYLARYAGQAPQKAEKRPQPPVSSTETTVPDPDELASEQNGATGEDSSSTI